MWNAERHFKNITHVFIPERASSLRCLNFSPILSRLHHYTSPAVGDTNNFSSNNNNVYNTIVGGKDTSRSLMFS